MEGSDEDSLMAEIKNDADLLEFAAKLQAAHDCMVLKERERQAATKRKPTYTGNSERTKRRKRMQGQRMEAARYPSVRAFFAETPTVTSVPETEAVRGQSASART